MGYHLFARQLASSTPGIQEKIKEQENLKSYDVHLDSIGEDKGTVDGNYVYFPRNIFCKLKNLCGYIYLHYFYRYVNRTLFELTVEGKENLKSIEGKGAVVTCNHINKLDCVAIKGALKGRKTYIVAASFNNRVGFLGDMMRVAGMLPMGSNYDGCKNFNHAVEKALKKDLVLFYPEQSEWWLYEKVRPFKIGAFHYAVKHSVPVLPLFITLSSSKQVDVNGIPLKKFCVHILPPLYPQGTGKKSAEELCQLDYQACVHTYESVYNKEHIL